VSTVPEPEVEELPAAETTPPTWWARPLPAREWLPAAATIVCIASVIAVTLWQLHPSLLLSNSTTTGGDYGGHYALPAFLNSGLLPHFGLTGWDPSWYNGFPLYTYYFVLPDLFTALASHVIAYGLAFKWASVMGSVLLPITAWAMARLFGLRRAFPGALAAITLCFLFDYTFTIDGGNLLSTLAGEYSYSLGIALALLFLGLMARGVRTGRHRGVTAVVFVLCLLAHLLPALFALAGAGILVGFELLPGVLRPRDPTQARSGDQLVLEHQARAPALWWGVSTVGLGLLLSAFWWLPFGTEQSYANPMGYQNISTYVSILLPQADWWALALAGVAAVAAFALRSRFGILFSLLGGASAAAVVFDPQGSLYNTRFLPLWFLCVYLMAGWGIATLVTAVCDGVERHLDHRRVRRGLLDEDGGAPRGVRRWPIAGLAGSMVSLIVALAVVGTPFVLSDAQLSAIGVTPGANQVTNWSAWNYSGYEGKAAYPEYRALITTMEHVGATYGCGQTMWQYDPSLNRFGTTMALMLLPYWSNGCIGSMEGLLFESSATTPYHFLNQAELSVQPSEPQVGLDYSALNVAAGIRHLQLLGVRYFMASSPPVQAAAAADPSLRQVAVTGPWTSTTEGVSTTTTWRIYQVLRAPVVEPLANDPAVEKGIGASQKAWLPSSEQWYDDPARWTVELAQSGPASWARVPIGDPDPPRRKAAATRVSAVHESDNSVRFDVSRIGTPVLVKVSYFPNWQVSGATGPYRVTPNLMVVVPTAHQVTLHYGASKVDRAGQSLAGLGVIGLVAGVAAPKWRSRRRRSLAKPTATDT
jgi:hypothetical protein